MAATAPVQTVLALAVNSARQSSVETLTVFFLALTLLTIAPLSVIIFRWNRYLHLHHFLSLIDQPHKLLTIRTPKTVAVLVAHLPAWKTLTVHLQTLSFLACTSSFLLLYRRRWVYGLVVCIVDLQIKGQFLILRLLGPPGHILIEAHCWVKWAITVRLDEEKSLFQVRIVR